MFSSLIGNYEGLFRNDNGQSDPNITSLFDLVSLLNDMYGRLPNDRPHQFKFNGSIRPRSSLSFRVTSTFSPVFRSTHWYRIRSMETTRALVFLAWSRVSFLELASYLISVQLAGVTSAIGSNRTPTTWNLDLGFYYPIKFSESKELRLTADWFNVTNTQRASYA